LTAPWKNTSKRLLKSKKLKNSSACQSWFNPINSNLQLIGN
jgi:hypothetical protein